MINIHCIFLKYGDVKNYKQLLDEVFMIILFKIIKVEQGVISQSRRLRLITLIILDITKTESNNKREYYTLNKIKMEIMFLLLH